MRLIYKDETVNNNKFKFASSAKFIYTSNNQNVSLKNKLNLKIIYLP